MTLWRDISEIKIGTYADCSQHKEELLTELLSAREQGSHVPG